MPAPRSRRQAAVVFLVLTGILVLAGCRMGGATADPTPHASDTGTSEFSSLDEAGVDRIRQTKIARLDMTSGRLEKASVGVAQASYGPEVNTRGSGKIELTIVAPNGEITGESDRIRFNTTDSRTDFSEVTYFLTAGSLDEFASLNRDGVERYGIDSVVAERWI